MTTLADRPAALAWLSAGLCLGRVPGAPAAHLAEPWILGVLGELGALPPPAVVLDIGALALHGTLRGAAPPLPSPDRRLRAAVIGYEDAVLGRLAADPALDRLGDSLGRLAPARRDEAIALLAADLAARLAGPELVPVPAGVARRVVRRPAADVLDDGTAALAQPGPTSAALAHGYEALAAGARRARTLLPESLLFLVENVAALAGLGGRTLLAQSVDAAAALGRALPRRMRARPRSSGLAARVADEDDFPAGGFASMSTTGSIENLVASELAYMEPRGEARGVDLFDVRYVENELLRFVRDDSVVVRPRREIVIAFAADLAASRFKDPELPWQRAVLAVGLVRLLAARLDAWLGAEDLCLRVVFPGGEALAAERDVLALLLGDLVARRVARLESAASLEAVLAAAGERSRRVRVNVVLLTAGAAACASTTGTLRTHVVGVAAAPTLDAAALDDEPWAAWSELALRLARALVNC